MAEQSDKWKWYERTGMFLSICVGIYLVTAPAFADRSDRNTRDEQIQAQQKFILDRISLIEMHQLKSDEKVERYLETQKDMLRNIAIIANNSDWEKKWIQSSGKQK